jgi:hypothetical protein
MNLSLRRGTDRVPCWDGKTQMMWVLDDGGRAAAGFKGAARDCTCRAIAIASGLAYMDVYTALNAAAKTERPDKKGRVSSARNGVRRKTIRRFLLDRGWRWVPTMAIGGGATVTLCEEDLPMGRLIVSVSRHMTCVIDRVVFDTFDPQRGGIEMKDGVRRITRRCVYGYFIRDTVAS